MSYKKGAYFERVVKRQLEKEGWFVVRSAGSRTATDLVALRKRSPAMLVQCKSNGVVAKEEVEGLRALARSVGCVPILAVRGDQGKVMFKRVNSEEAEKPSLDQTGISAF